MGSGAVAHFVAYYHEFHFVMLFLYLYHTSDHVHRLYFIATIVY